MQQLSSHPRPARPAPPPPLPTRLARGVHVGDRANRSRSRGRTRHGRRWAASSPRRGGSCRSPDAGQRDQPDRQQRSEHRKASADGRRSGSRRRAGSSRPRPGGDAVAADTSRGSRVRIAARRRAAPGLARSPTRRRAAPGRGRTPLASRRGGLPGSSARINSPQARSRYGSACTSAPARRCIVHPGQAQLRLGGLRRLPPAVRRGVAPRPLAPQCRAHPRTVRRETLRSRPRAGRSPLRRRHVAAPRVLLRPAACRVRVDLDKLRIQSIPPSPLDDRRRAEAPTQPQDVSLQRLARGRRRTRGPKSPPRRPPAPAHRRAPSACERVCSAVATAPRPRRRTAPPGRGLDPPPAVTGTASPRPTAKRATAGQPSDNRDPRPSITQPRSNPQEGNEDEQHRDTHWAFGAVGRSDDIDGGPRPELSLAS